VAVAVRKGGEIHGAHKLMAGAALTLWICVILAGRWIAYLDYLLPVE
jgi:hypothetical protein